MRDKLGRFVKGHQSSPKTEFKKGHISTHGFKKRHKPWNKNKQFIRLQGKNSCHWKGGKSKDKDYIYIYKPTHPFCNRHGYIRRSRFIMEKHLNRYLKPKEVIHHKGIKYPLGSIKNKQDDRVKNLRLFNNHSAHMSFHYPKGSKIGVNKK